MASYLVFRCDRKLMNSKTQIKKIIRSLGFEVTQYKPQTSDVARMSRLLDYHNINLVFDIGANIGQYSSFLRECGYSGKIVSFEPSSDAYSQLLKISEKDSDWEVAPQIALGNEKTEVTLNLSANSQSSSVLKMLDLHQSIAPDSSYVNSEVVKMVKLDDIAPDYLNEENNLVFLKIDVQGLEKQVLEGASQTLKWVKGIQVELSLVPLYETQGLLSEMILFLQNLGYTLYAIMPGFTDSQTGRVLQVDGIFFKEEV